MHLSTMLEYKKCKWFLSECNMSCSLLLTVMSNKCQYLHQYWLFLWRFFWHVPIRHIGRHLGCWNANSMYQSTTNEIGVLTVCNSEQPYLHQNKIFLWRFFWFGITQNKDKHWEGLNRGSIGKIKWNVPFFLTCQLISYCFCIMFRLLLWNWKLHINQQGNVLPDTLSDTLLS